LKFLFVSARFWPDFGGAERQLDLLAASLVRQGHAVTVLAQRSPGRPRFEERGGVEIVRLRPVPGGRIHSLFFGLGLSLFLFRRGGDFDLFHVNLASSPALFVAPWARRLRRPALLKLGASGPFGDAATSRRTAVGRWKMRSLQKTFSFYLCPNPAIRREFLKWGFSPERLVHFSNGVDTELFRPAGEEERAAFRKARGWTGKVVSIFTGRFEPQKNLPWLLERWADLAPARPDALLVLLGGGEQAAQLKSLIARRGLDRSVHVEPPGDPAKVRAFLGGADIFVLPSLAEGMSNSLLEAMSTGLAVLASAIPGNSDLVDDGVDGKLFSVDSAAEAVGAFGDLLDNPDLRSRLGGAARKKMLQEYRIADVGDRYLTLVADVPPL
jgi:glycosyltransferase involved in cell wall biosynthesis